MKYLSKIGVKVPGGLAVLSLATALSGIAAHAQPLRTADLTPLVTEAAIVAEIPLSAEALKLKATLENAGADAESLRDFYATVDYAPIWDDVRQAALLDVLMSVEEHGLPRARYDIASLADLLADTDAPVDAVELAASRIFLKYARDVSSGLLEPRKVDRDIVVKPPRPDEATLMLGLKETGDVGAFFAALAPSHPQYARLQAEMVRLKEIISADAWGEPVPAGKTLKPGQTSERIVIMRERLGRMNGAFYGSEPLYDDEFTEIVKAFQRQNGLNDDGVAGPKTLAAINASPEQRLQQVLVNLERQRWLNVERGARHIYVNQADFSVSVIDNGEVTFWSRTVIGKNKHRTQEFNDTMTHMVVNPTWHVPRSITTEEMLPKLKRNPGALGSSFQVMTRNGTRVNPRFVDFSKFSQSSFPFIIKQKPSGRNALGRVKFMFPNQFNIYLHDTPSKSLFNRDARAYSHGCVRVQKPFELAHVLLSPQSDNPKGLFQSVLGGGKERQLNLKAPVPIYLTYHSAWVDDEGQPQYRDDIYGRDKTVFRALSNAGVSLGAVEG